MSLCPEYCECEPCKHGWTSHGWEPCPRCLRERELVENQKSHEASIARQKLKIKVAPWRQAEDEIKRELEELEHGRNLDDAVRKIIAYGCHTDSPLYHGPRGFFCRASGGQPHTDTCVWHNLVKAFSSAPPKNIV